MLSRFTKAAQQHARDQWSVTTGGLGNFLTGITFGLIGDGCSAWQTWMMDYYTNELTDAERKQIKSWDQVHFTTLLGFNHNTIRVRFHDGRCLVLDPWRNRDNPVWGEEHYTYSIVQGFLGAGHFKEGIGSMR